MTRWFAALLVVAALSLSASGADPPFFPGKVHLLGSYVYNRVEWTENTTDGTIDWGMNGLTFDPDDVAGRAVSHQLSRGTQPIEGELWARYRVRVDLISDMSFVLGLYASSPLPFSTAPSVGAWFEKGTSGQVIWKVRNGGDPTGRIPFGVALWK
jgi:hypothetical protein